MLFGVKGGGGTSVASGAEGEAAGSAVPQRPAPRTRLQLGHVRPEHLPGNRDVTA